MKALIIGYGSIGKRHDEVLSSLSMLEMIDLVTKQNIENRKTYKNLSDVKGLRDYDYFVIASETHKHFEQLKFLEENVSEKTIFCEKPLFDRPYNLNIKNNKVSIGYVLRFHPLIIELKKLIIKEDVILASVKCGQYLPTWRPNTDYRNSYSAHKSMGGGVLLDLSHEIDYIIWLLGGFDAEYSYQGHISDLEIDSDDVTFFVGKTKTGAMINVSMDYISKQTYREIVIHTNENTFCLDLIANQLVITDKTGYTQEITEDNLSRNYMFSSMHQSILELKKEACSYKEGINVMQTIQQIQEKAK